MTRSPQHGTPRPGVSRDRRASRLSLPSELPFVHVPQGTIVTRPAPVVSLAGETRKNLTNEGDHEWTDRSTDGRRERKRPEESSGMTREGCTTGSIARDPCGPTHDGSRDGTPHVLQDGVGNTTSTETCVKIHKP